MLEDVMLEDISDFISEVEKKIFVKNLLTKKKLEKVPRTSKLLSGFGIEVFLKEILPIYFSESEIGKILKKDFPGWEGKLEKRLREASEVYYKNKKRHRSV